MNYDSKGGIKDEFYLSQNRSEVKFEVNVVKSEEKDQKFASINEKRKHIF